MDWCDIHEEISSQATPLSSTSNRAASLPSVFGLLSIYQICDYVQFFEALSPVIFI